MEATNTLIKAGHRHIAYSEFGDRATEHFSKALRRDGYRHAMEKAGYKPFFYSRPEREHYIRVNQMLEWLKKPGRPTAFLTYSPEDCYALHLAAIRLGLEVPRDFSLATFSDSNPYFTGIDISSWMRDHKVMARTTVDMIVDLIANPKINIPTVFVPFDPIYTDSTIAPPPPGS